MEINVDVKALADTVKLKLNEKEENELRLLINQFDDYSRAFDVIPPTENTEQTPVSYGRSDIPSQTQIDIKALSSAATNKYFTAPLAVENNNG